ncbi:MAG TPA: acyl-CoA dehydrogenase family protein, partial [Gemmatimonadaceae bacterium]
MDDALYFSEQHLAVREMVRAFAREEVAPVARHHDETATFPWDNVAKMAELGLLGIPWPEELGGAGLDLLSYLIAIHEMAKVDASHAI